MGLINVLIFYERKTIWRGLVNNGNLHLNRRMGIKLLKKKNKNDLLNMPIIFNYLEL